MSSELPEKIKIKNSGKAIDKRNALRYSLINLEIQGVAERLEPV
jgi:hypothetical protein